MDTWVRRRTTPRAYRTRIRRVYLPLFSISMALILVLGQAFSPARLPQTEDPVAYANAPARTVAPPPYPTPWLESYTPPVALATPAATRAPVPDVPGAELAPDRPDPTPQPTAAPTPAPTPQPTPAPKARSAPDPTPKPTPKPAPKSTATPKPTPSPSPTPTPTPTPKPSPTYTGTSHFWYPALGIDRPWRWYGCEYGGDPDGLGAYAVYRWGCAGTNNIYMMGHASGSFYPLWRGYHTGKLKTGQSVYYADAKGKVTHWKVLWIKHVTTTYLNNTAGSWATNAYSSPVMTLQTCDGSYNQYRIIVRLVPA
jgi:sortase family protein